MRRIVPFLALVFPLVLASPASAADFPDYLIIRERLGAWPRDNGGGRLDEQPLLARLVDASGLTLFEELHCDVRVLGADMEVELALGTVDPARNPLDLRFDGRWSVRVIACDEAACLDGIPGDPALCDGEILLDKPLQVVAYAWRSKYSSEADHALFADDCDRLDGLDSSDFMPAGTDEWVNETGDAMSGPLVLNADPTEDQQAATKKYVDEQIRNAIPRGYAILGPSLVSPPGFAPSGAYIATDGEWKTLAPLPYPTAATATILDGTIYARTEPGILEMYDAALDSWSSAYAPGAGQVIVALDGSLHLLGIDSESGEHWERPAGSPLWGRRAAIPDSRVDAVAAIAGQLFALTEDNFGSTADGFWSWDAGTDTWQRLSPPYCDECWGRTLVVFQGAIWAIGGRTNSGSDDEMDRVYIFDPAAGYWTTGPRLKRARHRPAAAELDGRLYVLAGENQDYGSGGGGYGYGGGEADSIEVFDPTVGTWAVLPSRVPSSRHLRAAVSLDGKIHVMGGGRSYLRDEDATDAHEAFTPQQRWYVHVKQ